MGQNQSLSLNGVTCHSPNEMRAFARNRGSQYPHNDLAGNMHIILNLWTRSCTMARAPVTDTEVG